MSVKENTNRGATDSNGPIEDIVIVGGGTAGWLAANCLQHALQLNSKLHLTITLIESSDIPTVGVGEATLPSLTSLFQFLGISETEFMAECNATFKLAIKFVNWSGLKDPTGDDVFWHPFGLKQYTAGDFVPDAHLWLSRKLNGTGATSYARDCFPEVRCCEELKAPRSFVEQDYHAPAQYAYHLDAGKLAQFLKKRAIANGVVHIVDSVEQVAQDTDGYISHLICKQTGKLPGDLFLDCSGFSGMLINKTLKEPFESYSKYLPCDSAIAMQVPHSEDAKINPYTTSTALSSGWVWNTPLTNRDGTGYVYDSRYSTAESAERELRNHVGKAADQLDTRHLKMRVGKTRNAWVKNCVSIGLSGGFIEPLESTGIYLIERAIEHLIHNFPTKKCEAPIAANFNRKMDIQYQEIRDFLVLHYCTTQREDTPFWKSCKYHANIPDSLQEQLELWRYMWPNNKRPGLGPLFPDYSYVCILAGMQRWPEQSLPLLSFRDPGKGEAILDHLQRQSQKLLETLPDHATYLKAKKRSNIDINAPELCANRLNRHHIAQVAES